MSDKPRDLTLERVNRLTVAIADLNESHTSQGRMLLRLLDQIADQLGQIRTEISGLNVSVRDLASEQVLLGNRIENALSRALHVNIRLDEIEDKV